MNLSQLQAATGATEAVALVFLDPLIVTVKRWSVEHVPEFLAQISVESDRLRRLQENLNYTTPERLVQVFGRRYFPTVDSARPYLRDPVKLANYVYDDRNPARINKLGNVRDGDGWRYRGRGLKQLTGGNNYAAYQAATDVPVLADPDLLLDPIIAADSAGWFWHANHCDALARDTLALTRRVNGGLNGLDMREKLTALAREAFA